MAVANGAHSSIVLYDLQPAPGVSGFTHRVKILLKEKGIQYEQKLIDASNKPQDFVELYNSITQNPYAKSTVPIIEDGDVKLAESEVVAEYLDTKYASQGPKLIPTDPVKLAKVRLFVGLFSQVQQGIAKILGADTQDEYKAAIKNFIEGWTVVNDFIKAHGEKGGDFLLGSQFSWAEAASLPFVYRITHGLSAHKDLVLQDFLKQHGLEHAQRWAKAGLERSSVNESGPGQEIITKAFGRRVKNKDVK